MTPSGTFLGIDVSKAQFAVAVRPTGAHWSSAHTETEITMLVARLVSLRPTLVVLEATGGLEISLAGACATAGVPIVVGNPWQVRDFAKATGHLAKTDTLAAQVLAQFAEAVRPTPRPCPMRRLKIWLHGSRVGANLWRCSWRRKLAGARRRAPSKSRSKSISPGWNVA